MQRCVPGGLLLTPAGSRLPHSVKAFSDSLLDLIVETPETAEGTLDYFGKVRECAQGQGQSDRYAERGGQCCMNNYSFATRFARRSFASFANASFANASFANASFANASFARSRALQPEVLYLGPDEQVLPEDINWIVQRAAKRGYRNPSAFMSSKPKAGINHKEVRSGRGTNVDELRERINGTTDDHSRYFRT